MDNLSLPVVLATSVIRSTHQGESHGGVYRVDLARSSCEQVLDWNDGTINWAGRGADRGLRGIAFYRNNVFLAASNEILEYDQKFRLIRSYTCPYLRHCHEIFLDGDNLWITSTGYDSILVLHLPSGAFTKGYTFRYGPLSKYLQKLKLPVKPLVHSFDPLSTGSGPLPGDTLHINNVVKADDTVYISGTKFAKILALRQDRLAVHARVPLGTHNATPYRGGILYNDTEADQIVFQDLHERKSYAYPIRHFHPELLEMNRVPKDHARQGFGRGLCVFQDRIVIGGSSPATISAYSWRGRPEVITAVNLTMDVRNAIHGLEVWPY